LKPLKDKREKFLSARSILFYSFSLLGLLFFLIPEVQAGIRYWVASSASNWNNTSNWSTSTGGSGGSSVPGSSDDVYFDSARVSNCGIDATVNVNSISISGYTGTITQQTGITITITTTFSQSSGTFAGGNSAIDINGDFSLSGGTFTSTSGVLSVLGNWTHPSAGTFNHNNGTVTFVGGYTSCNVNVTETFYNLTLNKSNTLFYMTIAYGDTLKTTGTLSLTRGYFYAIGSNTLEAQGNVTVGTGYYDTSNQVPLLFSGGNIQSFNLTGATAVFNANITVNKSGGEVDLASDLVMDADNQGLTLTAGTFDLSGRNLTVSGSGGSFTVQSGGNLQLQGGETITGTPTLNSGSTVSYDGTSTNYTLKNYTYSNLTIKGSKIFDLPANLTVNSTVTVTSGNLSQSNYNLTAGAITIGSSGTLRNWGTGSLTLGGNLSNSGTVDCNGGTSGCGSASELQIRSSVNGTQRSWSGSGTFNMVDVDVKDQAGTASITVYHGTNTGGNGTNWTFNSSCTGAPTAIKLISFRATSFGGEEVLLKWRTGYEVDNLGFHLYREENGELFRITPELIAGSALLAGSRTTLTAGHSYTCWDTSGSLELSSPGSQPSAVKYWLEDIDLSDKRTMHGPVTPVFSGELLPERTQAILLSEVGRKADEIFGEYRRARELEEKLLRRPPQSPKGSRAAMVQTLIPGRASSTGPGESLNASSKSPALIPSQRVAQWNLAAGQAVKLGVKKEGWYRVSQAELVAAGLDSRVSPRNLQLFVEGEEIPIVVTGEGKKGFEAIEFYGKGLDTASTDTQLYWLVAGTRSGKRVQEIFETVNTKGRGPISFPFTVEKKPRTIYFAALTNGEADNFFGPVIGATPVDQILSLTHLDPSAPDEALLEVRVQGLTKESHRVKVFLNHTEMGEITFEGQNQGILTVPVFQGGLLDGDNLVTLTSQGGGTDMSFVDTVRLTYWHTYTADNNTLRLTAMGGDELTIDGFSSGRIEVWDITDPKNVKEVMGTVKGEGTGYTVRIKVPGQGERTLWAMTEGAVEKPALIKAKQPSTWNKQGQSADLLIVAHSDFIENITPLRKFRKTQGYSVALIDVEDLYDEFSFGTKTPQALKDFLSRAKTYWRTPPRFVLLVGDASFDPKNHLGLGNFDFLPTKLLDTAYMETASDDWFVDFNGDGLPEMAIGRLPVRTAEETTHVVSKIINYDHAAAGNWTKEILLVADNNGDFDFETASQELGTLFPKDMTVWGVYRGQTDDKTARTAILGSINEGKLLVNYMGHGSNDSWHGSILTAGDAISLTNGLRLPVVVGMTCLNGFFQTPYVETLSEALLKAENGGAVAVWTSSGLTEPDEQAVLNEELIRLLFNGENLTLGQATARAKAAVTDGDIRRTWILFGDPTTRLKY
jgi:hypothetical protein